MNDSTSDKSGVSHGLSYIREKLRRLQEGIISVPDVPMPVTLLANTTPETAHGLVGLLVYPQDPLLGEPKVHLLPAEDVQPGLLNNRVMIVDETTPIAQPDDHDSYLYWPGTPEFDQVNAFYYATFTLRMMERYAQRVLPWSFAAPRLKIYPHMGELANAFYNEQAQVLGFHAYRVNGQQASTAQSADIVSHETAHAVLDGVRDLWNESFGLGCRALHESVADIVALLVALHDDALVQRVLKWTNDDLRLTNVITEVAEHLAQAEEANSPDAAIHTHHLRNAINPFVNMAFDELPYDVADPETMLSRQEHNYSRVFTGAFWDIFVAIYDEFRQTDAAFIAATRARRELGGLLMLALDLSPVGELDYADAACVFLTADHILTAGAFLPMLKAAFIGRRILTSDQIDAHLASLKALPPLQLAGGVPPHMLAATAFYEREIAPRFGWPGVGMMTPMGIVHNSAGYTFLMFFQTRPMTLLGSEYNSVQGSVVDLFGGVTLMFDQTNRLRSAVYRPVTDEDIRQARLNILDLLRTGRITGELAAVGEMVMPVPDGLHLSDSRGERLVKYPVMVDRIPAALSTLRHYLLAWQKGDSNP